MESKYQCPYCKYMSLKKWNVKKHVNNVHGIKNFPNANIKIANIDQQNMRQPEIHTKSECPIHTSEYRSIQEHQDNQKSRNISTQFSNQCITYDETKPRHEIIQHPQFSEYDRNIVEVLETRRRCFMDLCSLSKWDMIRHMTSDQYINLIIEACYNLSHYGEIRRKPYYKYITILANENVQYKRRILKEKGSEIVCLINFFILPSLEKSIENLIY